MILSFFNIRQVPRGVLKTEGVLKIDTIGHDALGFQHSPRDLANVNEWKIMFDPYIQLKTCRQEQYSQYGKITKI